MASLDFPVPVLPKTTSTNEDGFDILIALYDNEYNLFPINKKFTCFKQSSYE